MPPILSIIVIAFFLQAISSLTQSPLLGPTNKYVNISTITYDTTSYYNTATTTINGNGFAFNFAYAKANTNYRLGQCLNSLNHFIANNRKITIQVDAGNKTTTGITIYLYTNTANKINLVTTRIIILEQGFLGLYFQYYYPTIISDYRSPMTYSMIISLTDSVVIATAKIWLALMKLYLLTSSGNIQFGFSLNISLISTIQAKVVLTALTNQYFTIDSIGFCFFVFNPQKLSVLTPSSRYSVGTFSAKNGKNNELIWNQIPSLIKSYNAILGLTGFYYSQKFMNFQHFITPGVSISATSSNKWIDLRFSYFILQFFYCPDDIPFLLVVQNLCYDTCPARYYNNYVKFECTACPYDCYQCLSNGKCTSCNATTDFRQLDNITMRCIAMPGYYNNGSVTVAVACNASKCLTCTAPSVCHSCYPGKYLSGTNCMGCLANCLNCTSLSSCVMCFPYYSYVSSSCVINCSSIINCASCSVINESLICSACSGGFPLDNNSCGGFCGDGKVSPLQACDDGNSISSDGCSSTCLVQDGFYCTLISSTSSCFPCISYCKVCNDSSCIECNDLYIYINGSCTENCSNISYCQSCQINVTINCLNCLSGYEKVNQTCQPICGDGILSDLQICDDGNVNNGDGCSANCTKESGFYCFLNITISQCNSCITQCSICNDSNSCIECNNFYYNQNNSCIINCSSILSCETCYINSTLVCISCSLGYSIINEVCNTTCGDSIRVGTYQECDDGNNDNSDGCSSECMIQIGYFCTQNNNLSTCSRCIDHCDQCSNQFQCIKCQNEYIKTANLTCFIDCSLLPNCQQCEFNTTVNQTSCLNCSSGYYFDSNISCLIYQCGDGIKVQNQICDDNNLIDGDGCSSNCTIEPSFYCENDNVSINKSNCSSCMPFCSNCTNSNSCQSCIILYNFSIINQRCQLDCSTITLCKVCILTSFIACTDCEIGYIIGPGSTSCVPYCGDGIKVTEQECDDGNTADNDGCSSTCYKEFNYYCSQIIRPDNLTMSNCSQCLPFCQNCSSNPNDCEQCTDLHIYTDNDGIISCQYDCAFFSYCKSCNPNACLICNPGYTVGSASLCVAICGDGIVRWEQQCDDNNTIDSDGCSSSCLIEQNYECNIQSLGFSVCYLMNLHIDLISIIKDINANSLTISYQLSPFNPAFSTHNWTQMFQQISDLNLAFSSIQFNSESNRLNIQIQYAESIQDQYLDIQLNTPASGPLSKLPITNTTIQMKSHNNLLLEYYSPEVYQEAKLFSNLIMVASFLSLLMFFIGFYKGKLIGLQLVVIFQIAYLSIITIQNLTPLYSSFSYLSYSCGFNKAVLKSNVNIGSRFKLLNLTQLFINNYNFNSALVILPLIFSLLLYLINKFKYNLTNKDLTKYSELMKGEYCFNGLMFSGYMITLSVFIQVMSLNKSSSQMIYVGIAFAGVFITCMLIFAILLYKLPYLFGQFTDKFKTQSFLQSHYYCFMILERLFVGMSFGMIFLAPQNSIILGIVLIQIIVIAIKRPYIGRKGNLRPILNLIITFLISAVFIAYPMINRNMPQMTKYSAYLILGLLFCTLPYNIYFYIKNIKQDCNRKALNNELQILQEDKLIKQSFKNNPFGNIARTPLSTNRMDITTPWINLINQNNDSFSFGAESPDRLPIGDVKAKLQKIKTSNKVQEDKIQKHNHNYSFNHDPQDEL